MPDRYNQLSVFSRVTIGFFFLLYLLMLVYGTLYPLSGWRVPEGGFFHNFLEADISKLSRGDMIVNVLVYIPAGLLWVNFFPRRLGWSASVLLAAVAGTALSFALEAMQVFLPGRTSALSDLLLNGLGAGIGGGLAMMTSGQTRSGLRLRHFREDAFTPGALTNVGLISLGLWSLSQLSPLVPSLSVSNLREGLKPAFQTATGQLPFVVEQSVVYWCSVVALGAIFVSLSRSRRTGLVMFFLLVVTILLLKVPVLSRQLSLEALLGCAAAMITLALLHRLPTRLLLIVAGCFLLTGYVVDALRESSFTTQTFAFNWIPFRGHMQNIVGLANILASGWVFLGLGYVARYLCRRSMVAVVAGTGALLVIGLAALIEVLQLGIPGRVPDVTDVVIAAAAWGGAWFAGTSAVASTSTIDDILAR